MGVQREPAAQFSRVRAPGGGRPGGHLLFSGPNSNVLYRWFGPDGLAFSPDEKHLDVDDWDPDRKVVMRYDVAPDGSLSGGAVFFDMKEASEPEALDGLKVDRAGNLYVSGPGGVWILSPAARTSER